MSKCLRCGAGSEWIQGRVPDEPAPAIGRRGEPMIDKEKLRARILAEPDVDCEIGAPMSERDEIERLTKLTARLRDYSPENRQHVVHEAADAIDALQERVARAGTKAAADVLAERGRQVEVEGWTPEHDDEHKGGSLSQAAAWYATNASGWTRQGYGEMPYWPWDDEWCKPKDRRSDLVRAGALILAEIERLDRASPSAKEGP